MQIRRTRLSAGVEAVPERLWGARGTSRAFHDVSESRSDQARAANLTLALCRAQCGWEWLLICVRPVAFARIAQYRRFHVLHGLGHSGGHGYCHIFHGFHHGDHGCFHLLGGLCHGGGYVPHSLCRWSRNGQAVIARALRGRRRFLGDQRASCHRVE